MSSARWTAADVPDQSGRVVVITGANTGIGFESAAVLAARRAHVVLAVRNLEKGKDAAARIAAASPLADVTLQRLDLASLDSVRAAAEALRNQYPRIDLLINNGGVVVNAKSTTQDGFELQFGTNHLGHFALTGLLLDHLLPAVNSRIVTVSSLGHRLRAQIHFDDLQWDRHWNVAGPYGQSKLANLLFTYDLQRRLAGHNATIAVAAHPGNAKSGINQHMPSVLRRTIPLAAQSTDMGALPTLRAATDPAARGGQYFGPGGAGQLRGHPKVVRSSAQSYDANLPRRLWTVSEQLTGVVYPA
jgi:NAD(P)-dependent dehydrogenase (short-subunit alcohol dehydrogenase family)